MIKLSIPSHQKVFFASDQHLGAPTAALSMPREKKFLQWLHQIESEAGALILLGDLFDFWFEYKTVVPKGFVRILGKLAQMRDNGLPIYFFVGNHDLWMSDYFEKELGIPVFYKPQIFEINGRVKLFIAHGDGLGPGDKGYKRMKKVFTNPFSKWLFRWLHPDFGVKLAQYLSVKNKLISGAGDAFPVGETTVTHQLVLGDEILDTCTFTITVQETLGTLEIEKEKSLLYPNPVIDYLNIESIDQITQIAVYSLEGKMIRTYEINSKSARIDFASYASGIYIIKEISENHQNRIYKVTKK
ncbi:T9SS type A sorting domain-containing protein [Myroides ceti]|uniref:T9SS type A sorting domain-containing protein n=1 Tax=Paenimyroides ceti TaxID=395087 RepID=A0ABT8D133_9FLAO|nr:T9SS type A sorting domain-containing protein [Paenimyroides ceti]MDN3709557.1 T9SS type A sorting domain-containing protein [Paenimyroides ceti]